MTLKRIASFMMVICLLLSAFAIPGMVPAAKAATVDTADISSDGVTYYTVTFKNWDGTVLDSQSVAHGSAATAPSVPARANYEFTGWDSDFSYIVSDLVVNAQYVDTRTYLSGDFNGWQTNNVMRKSSGNIVSTSVELEPATYEFKIIHRDKWLGNWGTIEDTTLTTSSVGWEMTNYADNCKLVASGGKYVFNFNTSTNMLEIIHKANTYTVSFVDYNGTVLKTETVAEGESATAPANPSRPSNAQYTFTFAGWDKDFSNITADTTVSATYTQTLNVYTVKFVDYDGYTLSSQQVAYGSSATAPADPSRPSNAQYTYTFTGWDKDYTSITGDTTINATYAQVVNRYTVTFRNWDGTVISRQQVAYGNAANAPADPTRPADEKYTYTFAGWDKDFSRITGSRVITATYTQELNKFTVTFLDYDGTVLSTQQVEYGTSAVAPQTPTREPNEQFAYTFKEWDTDFTNITGVTTVTAIYTEALRKYTVTFLDLNGALIAEQQVEYGKAATAPTPPEFSGYIFTGWDADYSSITSDTIVNAEYMELQVTLRGDFNNWSSDGVMTGSSAGIVTKTLTLSEGTYQFKIVEGETWLGNWGTIEDTTTATSSVGWEMTSGADNCTLKASGGTYTFKFNTSTNMLEILHTPPKYTVNFVDWDGTLLKTETVTRGNSATAPEDPSRAGYDFRGWDPDFTSVTENITVTAVYEVIVSEYTVTFRDWDGTLLKTETVKRGESATEPEAPSRAADVQYTYTFKGWDKSFLNVTGNIVVNAVYGAVLNKYTVTFVDYDGTVIDTQKVEYGKAATAPDYAGSKDGYVLTGWDRDITKITGNTFATAVYTEDAVYLVGSFNSWAKTTKMAGSDTALKATLELKPGEYSFKILDVDKWYGNTGAIQDTTTTTSSVGWEMVDGATDCTLEASGGTYIFTYNRSSCMLEIEYIIPEYTVEFVDYDGTILKTEVVLQGEDATAPEDPVRAGYIFVGWDKKFTGIFADTTVNATYLMENVTYTVTFVDWDGTVLDTQLVKAGEAATAPTVSQRENYLFTGWDKEFSYITQNITVNALYQDQRAYLLGSFNNWATDVPMTRSEGSDIASTVLTLKAGTYTFKLLSKDVWYGNDGIIEDTTLDTSEIGWRMVAGATDTALVASGGKYTFNFDRETCMLEVLYVPVEYTVTFTDFNGAVLSEQQVKYGAAAVAPEKPTREGYLFAGWDVTFNCIEEDTVVTALYVQDITKHLVTFVDWDGTVLSTQEVAHGSSATAPKAPSRAGYIFKGWSTDFSSVTKPLTVTAKYQDDTVYLYSSYTEWAGGIPMSATDDEAVVRAEMTLPEGEYTFKLLHRDTWYGNTGTIEDTTATTSSVGWRMIADAENCTLKASGGRYLFAYNPSTGMLEIEYVPVEFTVVFIDMFGDLLSTQTVKLGADAVAPEVPKIEGYDFTGWDTEFTDIQVDTVVGAIYVEETVKHLVKFVDYNGRVLAAQMIEHGKAAHAPVDPVRVGYVFTGWDKKFDEITEDTIINARYEDNKIYLLGSFNGWEFINYFSRVDDTDVFYAQMTLEEGTYTFKLSQNDVWYTNASTVVNTTDTISETGIELVSDGSMGDTILKADGGSYMFFFDVTTNSLVIKHTTELVTVTYVNFDGTVLGTEKVLLGGDAKGIAVVPEKEGDETADYVFIGWDIELTDINEDVTATAVFKAIPTQFTVTFLDEEGNVVLEQLVDYGCAAQPPEMPLKEGYIQSWDKDISKITKDITTTVKYVRGSSVVTTIAGTFNGWDPKADPFLKTGSSDTLSIQMQIPEGEHKFKIVEGDVWYGNSAAISDTTVTTHPNGLQMDSSAGDCTFHSCGGTYLFNYKYETHVLEILYLGTNLRVTFVDWDGTVVKSELVEYGKSATAPDVNLFRVEDEHYSYVWEGWDQDFSRVVAPMRINATYILTPKMFNVTFADHDGTVLKTDVVGYGLPATPPEDPAREGYIFTGWDGDINFVPGEVTYTAQYVEDAVFIMGDFNNWQGTKMIRGGNTYQISMHLNGGQYKFKLKYGNDWYGNDGWIDDTTDYTNTSGWGMSTSAGNCTLNAMGSTYTFIFNLSTKTLRVLYVAPVYTVNFIDEDGSLIKSVYVRRGSSARFPEAPVKEGYIFTGWTQRTDGDVNWMWCNMTFQASYATSVCSIMGDFNAWAGTPMVSGDDIVYTATVELPAGYHKFKIKHYNNWYGNDGTIDNTTIITSDVGWEMNGAAGDCTLNAAGGTYHFLYNTNTRMLQILLPGVTYKVKFVDWDGTELSTQDVELGQSAVAPEVPERDGYTFTGWSANYSVITDDITIMALYGNRPVYLKGTFNNWKPLNPLRTFEDANLYACVMELEAGTYTFKVNSDDLWWGSDKKIDDSTAEKAIEMSTSAGDCTLNAKGGSYMFRFNRDAETLEVIPVAPESTVTFVDWDGTVLSEQIVKAGQAAISPEYPTREGLAFAGWDKDFTFILEDMTVTAQYGDKVTLLGSFGTASGDEMKYERGTSYSVFVEIEEGEYTFCVDYADITYCADVTINDTTITETAKSIALAEGDELCKLIATGGTYKFTFNVETGMLKVEKLPEATGDEVAITFNESENFEIITDDDPNAIIVGQNLSFAVEVAQGYKLVAVVYNMQILTDTDGIYTIENILSDANVIVVVERDGTLPTYTVTFTDKDGNTLKTEEVEYGQKATAPEAPAVEGYEFKGWSEEFDYVTMDMVVKAVYKKVVVPATTGKLRIEVTGGTGFTVSVNGSAARPQGTSYVNTKAPIGATVTVVANECQGLEFLGWVNEAGAIVSTAKTYTFTTSGNDVLRAVYKTDVEGVNVVIFKNGKAAGGKGQVLDMQYYAAGDEVVFPGAPTAAGYDFTGWDKTAEEIKALIAAGEDVTVLATWEAAKIYIDVAVNGGTISTPAQSNGKYLAYNALTVVANAAQSGKKFAYWTDAKGNIMSYDAEYKFFPATSTELTAVYVAEDEEIKKQPLVFIAADPTTAGEKITYTMSWDIDANIGTVTSAGLLVVNKADYNGDTFYHGTTDTKVFDRALGASAIKQKNTYGIGKGSSLYDNTYIACTFVVYTDAVTGESITVYSTPVEVYKPAP